MDAEDDGLAQAHIFVCEVMDEPQRDRLVRNIVGTLDEVKETVFFRVFDYWKNIDEEVEMRIDQSYQEVSK